LKGENTMTIDVINFQEKFSKFHERLDYKIIAAMPKPWRRLVEAAGVEPAFYPDFYCNISY
jgi:L-rhamnose isomerase